MKWLFKPCGGYRQNICLLASGDLSEEQKEEAQSHLASCADCRKYFEELKAVTGPLATWEKSFPQLEASPRLQMRWTKAIEAETPVRLREPICIPEAFQRLWRELLLPLRWHLAGMGALWIIVAILSAEPSSTLADMAESKAPPRQLLMALRENRRQISELINPPSTDSDVLPQVFVPRRRSEIQLPTAMA